MEPEQVERLLLSSLERPEQLVTLRQTYNLTKNHFPFYPEEAEFIWDYITEYSDPPSASLLEVKFPDFEKEREEWDWKFQHGIADKYDYLMAQDPDKFSDRQAAIDFLEEKKQEIDTTDNIFKLNRANGEGT